VCKYYFSPGYCWEAPVRQQGHRQCCQLCGAASSAAVGTRADLLSNLYLLQQLVNKAYVPIFAGKLSD